MWQHSTAVILLFTSDFSFLVAFIGVRPLTLKTFFASWALSLVVVAQEWQKVVIINTRKNTTFFMFVIWFKVKEILKLRK